TRAAAAAPAASVPSAPVTHPAGVVAVDGGGGSTTAAPQPVASVPPAVAAQPGQPPSRLAPSNAAAPKSEPTAAPRPGAAGGKSSTTTAPVTAAPSPGATPGAPPPAAPGGNLEPIRIGAVGTLSGPAGALLKDAVLAVQVWAKWKNAEGGINGHPIEYSVADDGADPARHRAQVQDFVERRKVIAFVQNQEGLVGPSAADYPTQHKIPVINTEGGGNYPYESPYYFPTTSSGDELA